MPRGPGPGACPPQPFSSARSGWRPGVSLAAQALGQGRPLPQCRPERAPSALAQSPPLEALPASAFRSTLPLLRAPQDCAHFFPPADLGAWHLALPGERESLGRPGSPGLLQCPRGTARKMPWRGHHWHSTAALGPVVGSSRGLVAHSLPSAAGLAGPQPPLFTFSFAAPWPPAHMGQLSPPLRQDPHPVWGGGGPRAVAAGPLRGSPPVQQENPRLHLVPSEERVLDARRPGCLFPPLPTSSCESARLLSGGSELPFLLLRWGQEGPAFRCCSEGQVGWPLQSWGGWALPALPPAAGWGDEV